MLKNLSSSSQVIITVKLVIGIIEAQSRPRATSTWTSPTQ